MQDVSPFKTWKAEAEQPSMNIIDLRRFLELPVFLATSACEGSDLDLFCLFLSEHTMMWFYLGIYT